jgi:hypothetical protein
MSRPHIKHQPIAAECQARPGEWVRVGSYSGDQSAMVSAQHIRTGRLKTYRPAGTYDAEVRGRRTAEPVVWARYVAG